MRQKNALDTSLATRFDCMKTGFASFDIISAIQGYWKEMNNDVKPVHVLGHQDNLGRSLNRLETLNVQMDLAAKKAALDFHEKNINKPIGTFNKGMKIITHNGLPISSYLDKTLYIECTKGAVLDYWETQGHFPHDVRQNIDWDNFSSSLSKLSLTRKQFVTKWLAGDFGCGKVMRIRKARITNRCPRCNAWQEDSEHIITCYHPSARNHWKHLVSNLKEWLEEEDTHPDLTVIIIHALTYWNKYPSRQIPLNVDVSPLVGAAFVEQAQIGWTSFVQGFFSNRWAPIQSQHLLNRHSRRSGHSWATALIVQLWQMIHAMWQHRNDSLHTTATIHEHHGLQQLQIAAAKELGIGLDTLAPIFRPFFSISFTQLHSKSVLDLKRWFYTIRRAREITGSAIVDEFSMDGPLRTWINLLSSS